MQTTIILSDMNFPTSTVNVLPHLNDLRKVWKEQDFHLNKEQQEEYDILLKAVLYEGKGSAFSMNLTWFRLVRR